MFSRRASGAKMKWALSGMLESCRTVIWLLVTTVSSIREILFKTRAREW